ncbi:MAG: guanylate kinase [Elusimicrobia bacterium]|nr:guanylate kinase [Elusimicrobiota bacterium]
MIGNHTKPTQGFAVIISAPSGAGKSTVCRKLLSRDRSLRYSISCTTRPPRAGERDGRDYFFLSMEEFKKKMHRHDFIEYAEVHDHFYGTPKSFIEDETSRGNVVILAIDVKGAKSVREKRPTSTVTVFLVPPSWRSLEERLTHRKQDDSEVVRRRLSNAPGELSQAKNYDYIVVNDSLDEAVAQIEAIITAERIRTSRRDLSALGLKDAVAAAGRRND